MSSIFAPVFEKKSFKLLAMDRGNGHSNNMVLSEIKYKHMVKTDRARMSPPPSEKPSVKKIHVQ